MPQLSAMTKRKAGASEQKGNKDPIRVFAEKVRDHKGLESRWAVLHESRVEYFRGKDFASLLKKEPDLVRGLGHAEEDVGSLLLREKLIVRCDRVVKTPRPGKRKLSKWPARLELAPDQRFSEDDAFFGWAFERSRPLWQIVLSFSVPIVTLACCLFPVFPHWCKLVVLYLCLTLLALISGILLLRLLVFAALWMLLGKSVWFFPNVLAEDASFSELLRFWPAPPKEGDKPPKWTSRLAFACLSGLAVWLCIRHAPDESARARYHKRVSNIIDEVLEWSPKLALSGKVEESTEPDAPAGNTTAEGTAE